MSEKIQFTKIFYCDPNSPQQKPHIERQHEILRRVLPKGRSFDDLTQADVLLLANHMNNYARDSLGGECPHMAARKFLGTKFPFVLGFRRIQPDDVILNTTLLK
jgi:IS30 family transposase